MSADAGLLAFVEQYGAPVFPCKPNAKTPLTKNGFKDASRDQAQIEKWAAQHPGCNWGMATGALSGFAVLDIDIRPDQGKDGDAVLRQLETMHGALPDTMQVLTPSGGRHLWFRTNGQAIQSGTDKLGSGLDIKAEGGYVIIPPSAINGRFYTIEASSDPADVGFAEMPAWLVTLLTAKRERPQSTPQADGAINEGGRNAHLTRLAGTMRRAGMTADSISAALLIENAKCIPPLAADEVRKIAASVGRYEPAAESKKHEWPPAGDVCIVQASAIAPESINWLWQDNLAGGKLAIAAGAPGTGKTTIALSLVAAFSAGGLLPDGSRAPVCDSLIWSSEDAPADTLVPRLLAAGANLERIGFIVGTTDESGERRPFDPAHDIENLYRAMAGRDIKLLIIDPIVSAVAGDSHKNTETRRALQPIADLAAAVGCAVLGISHFSKGTQGRDPLERVTGSLAFGALARLVFATAKIDGNDFQPDQCDRLFVRAKSNIGPDGDGFRYVLEQVPVPGHPGLMASRVRWGAPIKGHARDLLATAETTGDPEERTATDEAVLWLRELLTAGPMKAGDVQREARQAGIGDKPLRRAREKLAISPTKRQFAGGWWWALPSGGEDAH